MKVRASGTAILQAILLQVRRIQLYQDFCTARKIMLHAADIAATERWARAESM